MFLDEVRNLDEEKDAILREDIVEACNRNTLPTDPQTCREWLRFLIHHLQGTGFFDYESWEEEKANTELLKGMLSDQCEFLRYLFDSMGDIPSELYDGADRDYARNRFKEIKFLIEGRMQALTKELEGFKE